MTELLDDVAPTTFAPEAARSQTGLANIIDFGPDPGNLGMRLLAPSRAKRPMVVVLHGCRQTVEGYDAASGWSRLAREHDFALLYPEQRRDNNRDLCFSWFERADIERGGGEVESIRQMVTTAIALSDVDPRRIHVCGLSAGGAMAVALLATSPELFAGGAIIAGLPYGTAFHLHDAFESMSSGKVKDAKVWGDLVRGASPHRGVWPSVAVWHGGADTVVKPINAGEIVKQWTNVHGLGAQVPAEDHIGAAVRRVWRDTSGRACVTDYFVPGLGHGAPIADRDPPAPFFLPAGISSTRQIACDWGLLDPARRRVGEASELPRVPERLVPERLVPTDHRKTRRRLLSLLGL